MTVRRLTHLLPAGLLGVGAAVLVSCGSSGAGLIPAGNAQPLVKDFQAVEAAATKGNGDCTATKAALHTTERDFQSLPANVNAGLRSRLHEGIVHLQSLALELCAQPPTGTTGTTTTPPPAKTKSTPPTSTGETTGTTESGSTPGATTPSGGAEGGTSPETEEGNGEAGGAEGAGQGGGAAAGGGHEDNGLGNGGQSGNGGAGVPGGSEK